MISFWHFYGTKIGKVLRRLVREKMAVLLPDLKGQTVLVVGYGVPYLKLFLDNAARVIHLTPPYSEPISWPQDANVTTVAEDSEFPLPDVSVDLVVIIHALEHTPLPEALLHEAWRVLTSQGQILVVVPNRMGFWAQADATPFGSGRPFTERQLRPLLKEAGFALQRSDCALFLPPGWTKARLNFARWIEKIGQKYFPAFAGLILLQAQKHVYAVRPLRITPKRRLMLWPTAALENDASIRHKRRHDRP